MSELFNGAREALERAKGKAAPMVEKILNGVDDVVDSTVDAVKEVADDTVGAVKETAGEMREKAAPMVDKVRDAVKEGAEKVGDLFRKDAPGLNVKNEFFADLDQQVRAQKDAAKAQAEEMQRRLHEMLHGKKEE